MAVSATVQSTVFGNLRCAVIDVDAGTLTSYTIVTGLNTVQYAGISYGTSYTSGAVIVKIACNVGSAGTTIPGNIFIQSGTSGDTFKVFCIGE